MANYDGKVIISTELDNSGIEQGASETKSALSEAESAARQMGIAVDTACDSAAGDLRKVGQEASAAAKDIAAATQSIKTPSVDTSAAAKVKAILTDTTKSAKSQAAAIAAIYKKQGMSQSEAMKKAWSEIERTSSTSTKKIGNNIEKNIGGATQRVTGKLGGLKNVLGRLGAAIAAAFSVRVVVQFGAASVKAANELENALKGLKSIMDGQGRSFSDAKAFIEEYTKDGLIPAANAITAYKNLAMRGYDDSQIRQVMIALKDASAFGRQASYSMGEAVQSATEGLKNENSILVDNAGVTKNVAKMWEEYAESIGTTSNNLTLQQKIQAEVNGITAEAKYQAGDATKVAGTFSGQLSQLSFNFNELKKAVGNAIIPIAQQLLPVINDAIASMTRFAKSVAEVVAVLFGKADITTTNEAVAESANAGAEAEEALANATAKAGKEAKRALAGFDELTKLQAGGSTTSSTPSVSTASAAVVPVTAQISAGVEDGVSPKIQAIADKIRSILAPFKAMDLSGLKTSFSSLGEEISKFGDIVWDALGWAWEDILEPLAEWTIEEATPAALDMLSEAFRALNAALEPWKAGIQSAFESAKPFFSWIGDTVLVILNSWKEFFGKLADVFAEKGPKIQNIIAKIGEIFALVWAKIEPIMTAFREVGSAVFSFIGSLIADTIGKIIDRMSGLLDFISAVFQGDWKAAWMGVKKIFSSIWESLVSVVKTPVNAIIGLINGLVEKVCSGLNLVINGLNSLSIDIPDWVPVVGGQTWGISIPTIKPPKIPYLAKGAVLPANKPFAAIVGDQKHGTNVEAPLSTIQEAVALVMDEYAASNLAGQEAIIAVLRDILQAVLGIEIGDRVIGEAVQRYNAKMAVVRGG